MDVAERVAGAVVAAERARFAAVPGAEVVDLDGLVLTISNLPDPSLNGSVVAHEPDDAMTALRDAERELGRRGLGFGVHLQRGRHRSVDAAVRAIGLELVLERPALVIEAAVLPEVRVPDSVEIRRVRSEADADALARVDAAAFGGDLEVARRFYGAGALAPGGHRAFVAWHADEPVGISAAYPDGPLTGVYGVGVVPRARGAGLGSALTVHAVRAVEGTELAWLHPSPEARSMYERLGFRRVSDWEVWARMV